MLLKGSQKNNPRLQKKYNKFICEKTCLESHFIKQSDF